MPTKIFYRVRCTVQVLCEMARYDGSVVQSATDPELGWHRPGDSIPLAYADECTRETTWEFILYGVPTVRRWASFGVSVSYGATR